MINNLFRKPINRPIEGVVKADNLSDDAVFQEVDEYVITAELAERFDGFFDKYSGSIGTKTESVGVWISGFFGSGKSHLLKILSYILSSRRLHSDIIGELFLDKVDDAILRANINKALTIKTDTILFNIDQKTDTGAGKRGDDAILNVFMKVFNEMRGYYPKQGYIADFEKKLDADGLYDTFKTKFESHSGTSWITGREQFEWEVDNIAKAISEVRSISYESAQQQVQKLDTNYVLSVEDFADEVNAFIKLQEPNYRLIFMVDEVGQFIGENSRLMLNLQTIVESLATKCQGQAWVIVTSQSAVKDLVDTNKLTEIDFSKILGRFKVKLPLTSQNANEVIQKRLLDKKEEFKPDLASLYTKHHNSIASIIYFSERGRQYHNYRDNEEFILTYPFIPYQLDLFQSCIVGLSKNEAFQGKHQSVGERSMLDVIQSVAKAISEQSIGTLASFDYFYDGIENIVVPESKKLMTTAQNSLDPFSLKVLKVLFMVKYVNEFNATLDHLTTLLVDSLEVDIAGLKESVKKALSRLQNEVYIQKVGDNYEFLTDKEKDVENEIKAITVDEPTMNKELADWLFENIIGISKFRYAQNRQDYAFVRKMDSIKVKGKDEELALNVITPIGESYDDEKLVHKSIADNDLIMALSGDFEFEKELRLFLQTKKYIPQKNSGNLSSTERQILIQKQEDNNTRRKNLTETLKSMFEEARVLFNGTVLDVKSNDPKTMVENAFNEVLPSFYTNLSMLRKEYKEQDIKTTLTANESLLDGSLDALDEAEQTMFNVIKRMGNEYQTITVAKMLETFSKKPYGWYQAAVMCMIASLYNKKLIDITEGGTLLNRNDVHTALTNNRKFASTIIKAAAIIDEKRLKKSKDILADLLPESSFSSNSAREIWEAAKNDIERLINELEGYKRLPYPFAQSFEDPIEKLHSVHVSFDEFFDTLIKHEDALLDMKDDILDKLLEFMRGNQRKIYDDIAEFTKRHQTNLYHISSEAKNDLFGLLKVNDPFRGNKVQKANASLKVIRDELNLLVQQARSSATEKIDAIIITLQEDDNFQKVPTEGNKKNSILRPFLELKETVESSGDIDFIRQRVAESNLTDLKMKAYARIAELLDDGKGEPGVEPIKVKETISIQKLKPRNIGKIENEADISKYIEALENNLRKQIEDGKQVIV